MKVLYLAGPLKGRDAWVREGNIRNAEAIALEVWAMGIVAQCPHTMTRFYGTDVLPEDLFIQGDIELMLRCDGVLAMDGWLNSAGAKTEVQYACERGMPVFYSLAEVEELWVPKKKSRPRLKQLSLLSAI